MPACINHIATVSINPRQVGTAYETMFGLNFLSDDYPPSFGEVLHDGNVTLALQARLPGHRMGLDHFGMAVEDIEATLAAIRSDHPAIGSINRPDNCPFPGVMTHDPAGNIFALTDKPVALPDRDRPWNFDRWSDGDDAARVVNHYAIRTRKLDECADFYEKYFGLTRLAAADDPNHYLSDGRVTLMLIPWSIQDYGGISVTGRGPDHIGFRVEESALVTREIEMFFAHFGPGQAPIWLLNTINERSDESQVRAKIIADSCPIADYQFTDKDGTYVVISDRNFGE